MPASLCTEELLYTLVGGCEAQDSLSFSAGAVSGTGVTFDRAGDAMMEGGEAGFSGSTELAMSASRLKPVLVNQKLLESGVYAYLNAFAFSLSFC